MKTPVFSRRHFMRVGTAAAAITPAVAGADDANPAATGGSGGCCVIKSGDFYNVERGNPLPYKLPPEKQREIGMVRETWQLEVIADPASDAKIERPLLKANG